MLGLSAAACAQNAQFRSAGIPAAPVFAFGFEGGPPAALADIPVPRPRMAPELALQVYNANAQRQLTGLGSSSDVTVVEADLLSTGQKGRFELRRYFAAPKSLAYGAVKFVGDTFVKTNVITKLLQAEVEHVEHGEGSSTAITDENYKFSYKGMDDVDGAQVYVYQIKPRKKRTGLFKGKVMLDVYSGRIRRAEGTLVKTPSVFVKKIEFTQDYQEVGEFSLPTHTHSIASTRVFGKAIVDVFHSDYAAAPTGSSSGSGSASGSSAAN